MSGGGTSDGRKHFDSESGDGEIPAPKKNDPLSLNKPKFVKTSEHAAMASDVTTTGKKENAPSSHWNFLSEDEQATLGKKCVPNNTATMTKWEVTNFLVWQTSRNKQFDGDEAKKVPCTLL